MFTGRLPWLAAGLGLLVSPDHLRLWGNLAGRIGLKFWIVTIGAAAVFALTVACYRRLALCTADKGGYLSTLQVHGGFAAVALALASRLALTIGVSTGVLVTAGFVFNETFVYWFPNFAFAFLYLAFVALVHCWGYELAERVQSVLLGITLLGLVVLVLSGFRQMGLEPDASPPAEFSPGSVFTGLLLFVGFDLGIHRSGHIRDAGAGTTMMLVVLGITVVLLGLWGTISLEHVPAKRLAETSIPYTLAARKIGGQTGRILMGTVVIAGAGCAVISLFSATARMVTALVRLEMLPSFCLGSARRSVLAISVLAAAIASMMAAGFAGEPELEVFIRAAFLLWLLHLLLVHLAAFKTSDAKTMAFVDTWTRPTSRIAVLAAMILGAGTVYLWVTDVQRMLLMKYMLAVWTGGALMLFPGHLMKRRKTPPMAKTGGP